MALTPFEVIAKRVGAGRHLLEHPTDDRLLPVLPEYVLVELHEAGLPAIVHYHNTLDHFGGFARVGSLMRGRGDGV